jgi:hypothetical protein
MLHVPIISEWSREILHAMTLEVFQIHFSRRVQCRNAAVLIINLTGLVWILSCICSCSVELDLPTMFLV